MLWRLTDFSRGFAGVSCNPAALYKAHRPITGQERSRRSSDTSTAGACGGVYGRCDQHVLDSCPIPRVSSAHNNDRCTAWDDVLDERSCVYDIVANGLGAGGEE